MLDIYKEFPDKPLWLPEVLDEYCQESVNKVGKEVLQLVIAKLLDQRVGCMVSTLLGCCSSFAQRACLQVFEQWCAGEGAEG